MSLTAVGLLGLSVVDLPGLSPTDVLCVGYGLQVSRTDAQRVLAEVIEGQSILDRAIGQLEAHSVGKDDLPFDLDRSVPCTGLGGRPDPAATVPAHLLPESLFKGSWHGQEE
jgi:hypothetical protein